MQAVTFLERLVSADICKTEFFIYLFFWDTLVRNLPELVFHIFFPHIFCAYVLSLPLKQFHIKKWDNPGVNLRDGVILCPGSVTTLTALKA